MGLYSLTLQLKKMYLIPRVQGKISRGIRHLQLSSESIQALLHFKLQSNVDILNPLSKGIQVIGALIFEQAFP